MTGKYSGRRFLFDLETDGLLPDVTVIHCAVAIDLDTEEVLDFKPNQIGEFLELYKNADRLYGHNIIPYDCAVIEKLHGIPIPPAEKLVDTLNLARLVFPDIKSTDMPVAKKWKAWETKYQQWLKGEKTKRDNLFPDLTDEEKDAWDFGRPFHLGEPPKEFPGYLVGSHSLEAWGYRLGAERKGDYSKEMKAKGLDPWASWNEDMHAYMLQDGKVNLGLLKHLMRFEPSEQSIRLEMRVQRLMSQVERNGWPFDVAKAQELYMFLCAERDELSTSLRSLFPAWVVQLEDFIPKRNNKTKGYIAGVPVERFETIEFNPSSRDHIADRLQAKYGWKPTEYTASGKPKIDDDVLTALPYPEAKQLARYFTIQKRIGQLAEGAQAWLRVQKNGFIHGRYTTNGAVSGRATHSTPNVGQVPAVGADFGKECRELFTVLPGFVQLGADQAGLELRCFASFLAVYDGGKYMEVVLNGDVHWENAKALMGWPDDILRDDTNPAHKKARNLAKTFIYALLYGSGDMNLGQLAGVTEEEVEEWKTSPQHVSAFIALRDKLRKIAERRGEAWPTKQQCRYAYKGSLLREAFYKKFPALPKLMKAVEKAAKKGWIKGLDGRRLPVRHAHAALNLLLQSAGAVICKQWIVDVEDALIAAGLKHSWQGDFVILGWIHDELQIAVREGLEDQVAAIVLEAARAAGNPFPTWRCPTDGDTKIGRNWAECH